MLSWEQEGDKGRRGAPRWGKRHMMASSISPALCFALPCPCEEELLAAAALETGEKVEVSHEQHRAALSLLGFPSSMFCDASDSCRIKSASRGQVTQLPPPRFALSDRMLPQTSKRKPMSSTR